MKRLFHHYQMSIPAEYDAQRGWIQFKRGRCEGELHGNALKLRLTTPNLLGLLVLTRSLNRHVALFGQRENIKLHWKKP